MKQLPRPVIMALMVLFAGALLMALLLPLWNQKKMAAERLSTLYKHADAVTAKADELMRLKQLSAKSANRPTGTLFSEIDGITVRLGIRPSITSIKPSNIEENGMTYERVSVTAAGLYQQKGVAFLYALEKERQGIQIENVTIRRSKENLWDLALTARRATRSQEESK